MTDPEKLGATEEFKHWLESAIERLEKMDTNDNNTE
jgi:hypothetical protein